MSSAVTLPIKFLADNAPTVVATVGSTERTLQLDIVCSNVLVRCVDDAKCPEHCAGDVEIINYSSYHKIDNTCMLPGQHNSLDQGLHDVQELSRRSGRCHIGRPVADSNAG
ncbi:hypothetical protein PINS_up021255 [Pythium insidiosum]|nr:hypothetical protein PINS_up021255 [Pythium insidiosum]